MQGQSGESICYTFVELLKLFPIIVIFILLDSSGEGEALVEEMDSHHPTSVSREFVHVLFKRLFESQGSDWGTRQEVIYGCWQSRLYLFESENAEGCQGVGLTLTLRQSIIVGQPPVLLVILSVVNTTQKVCLLSSSSVKSSASGSVRPAAFLPSRR